MRALRQLGALHGVDRQWWAALAGSWLVVIVAARIGLPQVDPDPVDRQHPLERLSTFALVLPVLVHAAALSSRVPWLEGTRTVLMRYYSTAWIAVHAVSGGSAAAIAALAMPLGVDPLHVAGAWLLLFSTAALMAASQPEGRLRPAAVVLLALVGVMSFPGLVPWQANVLYNGTTTGALGLGAVALLGFALALPILRRW